MWKYRSGFFQTVSVCVLTSVAVLSHGFLDTATNGGLGVGLLLPFSEERYFLPFRPIEVSPFDPATFVGEAARVLSSEVRWVWIPLLVASGVYRCGRIAASMARTNRQTSFS
jgi:inner membrane protein